MVVDKHFEHCDERHIKDGSARQLKEPHETIRERKWAAKTPDLGCSVRLPFQG